MKNEGLFDRIIRFILGLGSFYLAIYELVNGWKYFFYFLGLILIVTSITGYCGLYKLLKISTIKKKELVKKKFIPEKEDAGM